MPANFPTPEAYAELQAAFDQFNAALFENQLPPCLITLQREKRTYGYFCDSRFSRRSGERSDEIAMNPSYFAVRSIRETLSTLVHEMVHQWQFHFGKPGRRGYHNREWAARMELVGLMPSDSGEPGGKKVGERMTHYIAEGGPFDVACAELLTRAFTLSWVDRFPPVRPKPGVLPLGGDVDEEGGEEGGELEDLTAIIELPPVDPVNKSNRLKYRCPSCGVQVWGKPGLRVLCGGDACEAVAFEPV